MEVRLGVQVGGRLASVEVGVREFYAGADRVSCTLQVHRRVFREPLRAPHAAAGDLQHLLDGRSRLGELEHAGQRALHVPTLDGPQVQRPLEIVQPAPQLLGPVVFIRRGRLPVRAVEDPGIDGPRVFIVSGRSVHAAPVLPEAQRRGDVRVGIILGADRDHEDGQQDGQQDGDEAREGEGSNRVARSRRHGPPRRTLNTKLEGSRVRYPRPASGTAKRPSIFPPLVTAGQVKLDKKRDD